jgi:hypothetical protein
MKNKVVLGSFVLVLSSFVLTPRAYALTTTPTGIVSPRPTKSTSVTPQAKACEVLGTRMTEKLSMYQERETNQITKYQTVMTTTTALLASLDTEGKDTTQARTDLATFSTNVSKLQTDFSLFESKMTEVIALPCTNVQTYLSKVQDARTLLRVVRIDHGNIQKFYNSVLRTDLLALRGEAMETETGTVSPKPRVSITGENPKGKPSAKPTRVPNVSPTN